jgi:hypothetical protein
VYLMIQGTSELMELKTLKELKPSYLPAVPRGFLQYIVAIRV